MPDQIHVHVDPTSLDPGEALAFVSSVTSGGTSLFVGTVRSPNEGEEVDHLDYEVWEERVDDALERIARSAIERLGAERVYVAHRSGKVPVGEPSVVVAVSAPHRAQAFEACRHVIDTLKESAPIWKKEVTTDGSSWVGMPT